MKWIAGLVLTAMATGCSGTPSGPSTSPIGLACGEERWAVKTLSDPDARRVNFSPIATTVSELTSHPAHCDAGPDQRTYDQEFRTYEIVGRVTRVQLEDDHDYHFVLADLIDSSITMITEIADPSCEGAISSPFVSMLREARTAFLGLFAGRAPSSLVGLTFRVRGVGFYDFNHGQIGRARNCIELHPVLSVQPSL